MVDNPLYSGVCETSFTSNSGGDEIGTSASVACGDVYSNVTDPVYAVIDRNSKAGFNERNQRLSPPRYCEPIIIVKENTQDKK